MQKPPTIDDTEEEETDKQISEFVNTVFFLLAAKFT